MKPTTLLKVNALITSPVLSLESIVVAKEKLKTYFDTEGVCYQMTSVDRVIEGKRVVGFSASYLDENSQVHFAEQIMTL